MKASLSTIRYIGGTETDLLAVGVEELTRLATNRLGGLEGVEEYGKRFDGAVVAKVITCVDHENSDHLHVCMIDDGGVVEGVDRDENGHVQVVCGAPNVGQGQTVVWLPPGSTVPSSYGDADPFVLSKREIRGVLSNGMLASPSELGLFENHDGILVIQESEVGADLMKPGTEFKKLYGLDDVLFEFENKMFTHRPDCFGQIGLARELAGIQGLTFTSPDWYWKIPRERSNAVTKPITVFNDAPEAVPRIMAVALTGVKVGESPVWLKSFITRMGGKPVNNVVDVSNYIMFVTGQPTHAYDLNKIAGATIGARYAKKGESIALLNGKTTELTEEDIVIADVNGPVGIAGVMGGSETGTDDTTTDLLLEVASFDMYSIRRTSMRHGLFTDAVTRFSKGQSPLQNDRVLDKFIEMLIELTGGEVAGEIVDVHIDAVKTMYDQENVHQPVKITPEFINARLGTSLSAEEIMQTLRNVEMAILEEGDELEVHAPFFRTDIELKEDIVEEVGRLYGFDRLELKLPVRTTKPAPRNELNDFKSSIRNSLSSAGANEVLSYSFVHGDTLKKVGIEDVDKWCYHIRNAISPDLQYYRPSMIPSLITKIHPNLKSDMVRSDDNEFALFEIGKVHVKGHDNDEGLPNEMERLVFVFASDEKTAKRKYAGSATYMAKHYLLPFLTGPVEFAQLESNEYPITAPFEKNRSATISIKGQVLGVVGEFRQSVKKAFKLPDYCAGFELDLSLLKEHMAEHTYEPISTYPKTQQDITLSVPSETSFSDVIGQIRSTLADSMAEHGYEYRLQPRDIFAEEDSATKNLTFRIWLWHPHKTLTTDEVNNLLNNIAESAKYALKAERV